MYFVFPVSCWTLACTYLLPLNETLFVLISWEVCEILHSSGWLYIPLYQHGCTMYAMRDRDNVQMPFVQRAGLQGIGIMFILFCSGRAEGWKASSRVTCSYCVEYNKTRSSSTVSDLEHSSSASDVLLYHAKRTLFSHSKRILQNMRLVPKLKV